MRIVLTLFTTCALVACSTTGSSTVPTDSSALVRRLYADYLNPGHLERLDEVVSDDFAGPGGLRGGPAFAAPLVALRTAFPDLVYTLEDVVGGGDRVAARWSWRGTHSAPFRSFAATGKVVTNTGFAIFQIVDGRIVRSWIETDRLGFLQQLGAVPYDPAFGPGPIAPAAR